MRNKLLKKPSVIQLIPSGSKIKLGNRKLQSESSRKVAWKCRSFTWRWPWKVQGGAEITQKTIYWGKEQSSSHCPQTCSHSPLLTGGLSKKQSSPSVLSKTHYTKQVFAPRVIPLIPGEQTARFPTVLPPSLSTLHDPLPVQSSRVRAPSAALITCSTRHSTVTGVYLLGNLSLLRD